MDQLPRTQKPQSVVTAVRAFWASLGLGAIKVVLDHAHLQGIAGSTFAIVLILFTMALIALLTIKVSRGRNWARITLLVLVAAGLIPSFPVIADDFSRSAVVGLISIAQAALQVYAVFLLFTKPGSTWFRKPDAA